MLIRNSAIYIVAKLVPGLLGMVTTALLTHILEPAQYGLYALALVVMTFGSTIAFDWLGLAFLRVYQARRDDPLVISTFVQIFIGLMGLTAILALLAWLAGAFSGAEAPACGIGIVMMWSYAWFELVARFEIANFRPGKYLAMNLGRAAFILAGAAGAGWLTGDPILAAVGTAVGTLLGAVLGGFKRWGLGRRHFDPALARTVAAFGLPLAASLAMSGVINSGTRALVQILGSTEALGLYTAALMLVQNTLSVAAAGIASAGYSLAVRAVETGDPRAARRQLLANGSLLLAVLAPAALGMGLTAHGIAVTLVGRQYVDAVAVLTPWMAAGAFFANFRAHYLDHAFQLGKRQTPQIWVTALAAAVALALNLWLIPILGARGAGIAVTVAMAVSCVHAVIAGRGAYTVPLPLGAAWRIGCACVVLAAGVLLVPGDGTRAFVMRVVAGGTGYVAVAIALDLLGARAIIGRLSARLTQRRARASAPATGPVSGKP